MLLPFTKMHGLGNDFIVVESLSREISLTAAQIRTMSSRTEGIGFDQLLMIEPPRSLGVDFNYRIFNADGNEVEQCGNGARCLGRFVKEKKLSPKNQLVISTMNSMMTIEAIDRVNFRVDMGEPKFSPDDLPFSAEVERDYYTLSHAEGDTEFAICSMGNPHAVVAVDDVDNAAVNTLGPIIESHPQFPEGVNAGFMQIQDRASMRLRVYERGAGETAACGTGACAAAAVARRFDLVDSHLNVQLPGGALTIDWNGPGNNMLMTGSTAVVFDGKIKL